MQPETKTCRGCQRSFTIEADDFAFYGRIKVPPPTLCPDCRLQRRYAWRNDRNLYRRECDLCKKSIVTMYSPSKPFKVYCPSCWWGDGWDAAAYGKDFDFSRPFFGQFKELQPEVPRIALVGKNSVNSEYINHGSDNKNCFMCSSAVHCEDSLYSDFLFHSANVVDCNSVYKKGERCYECIDVQNCYRCQYSMLINDCSECFYCYDCRGCSDCFLSTNLRNKKYCFLNQQYDKETYKAKVQEWNLGSHADREKLYAQYQKMLSETALRKYAVIEQSLASTGDYIFNCRNAVDCFDAEQNENVKYCINTIGLKDAMDSYRNADKMELVYESQALIRTYDISFCNLVYDSSHIQYSDNCFNSQNLFGCIGMKKGEYSILNKRYSPEAYAKLQGKIIEHMRGTKEYGEFFPIELSPFGYNETHAQLYLPALTKEEVLARGWNWENASLGTFGKETMQPADIPDAIDTVDDSILKAALKCTACSRNYNIVRPELDFYRHESLPIPRLCPACRDRRRIGLRTPRKLWERQCMCKGPLSGSPEHFHTAGSQCPNRFQTSYAPERPETIYCEQCYNSEIV